MKSFGTIFAIVKTQMTPPIPVTELKYELIIMPDYSTTNTKHYFSIFQIKNLFTFFSNIGCTIKVI